MSSLEKARPILALYRQILRAHSALLPEPMKTLGDKYAKAEFQAHLTNKKTTIEHWKEFNLQWNTYLSQIRGETGDLVSGVLDPEILANLPEDKKLQLERLREETSRPFLLDDDDEEKQKK
jgi:hypothetical protein